MQRHALQTYHRQPHICMCFSPIISSFISSRFFSTMGVSRFTADVAVVLLGCSSATYIAAHTIQASPETPGTATNSDAEQG